MRGFDPERLTDLSFATTQAIRYECISATSCHPVHSRERTASATDRTASYRNCSPSSVSRKIPDGHDRRAAAEEYDVSRETRASTPSRSSRNCRRCSSRRGRSRRATLPRSPTVRPPCSWRVGSSTRRRDSRDWPKSSRTSPRPKSGFTVSARGRRETVRGRGQPPGGRANRSAVGSFLTDHQQLTRILTQ